MKQSGTEAKTVMVWHHRFHADIRNLDVYAPVGQRLVWR